MLKLGATLAVVCVITAATISSRAVANGVREALTWYRTNFPQGLEGEPRG